MDGRVVAPFLLLLAKFKVPSHSTRYGVSYAVPAHITIHGRNNPLDRTMRLANESNTHEY